MENTHNLTLTEHLQAYHEKIYHMNKTERQDCPFCTNYYGDLHINVPLNVFFIELMIV